MVGAAALPRFRNLVEAVEVVGGVRLLQAPFQPVQVAAVVEAVEEHQSHYLQTCLEQAVAAVEEEEEVRLYSHSRLQQRGLFQPVEQAVVVAEAAAEVPTKTELLSYLQHLRFGFRSQAQQPPAKEEVVPLCPLALRPASPEHLAVSVPDDAPLLPASSLRHPMQPAGSEAGAAKPAA